MPEWFLILAKVLAMAARLVPMIEEQFGAAPGQGPAKKEAVMGRLTEYVRGSVLPQYPKLTEEELNQLGRVVSHAVDSAVAGANRAGVFAHGARRRQGPTSGAGQGEDTGVGSEVTA